MRQKPSDNLAPKQPREKNKRVIRSGILVCASHTLSIFPRFIMSIRMRRVSFSLSLYVKWMVPLTFSLSPRTLALARPLSLCPGAWEILWFTLRWVCKTIHKCATRWHKKSPARTYTHKHNMRLLMLWEEREREELSSLRSTEEENTQKRLVVGGGRGKSKLKHVALCVYLLVDA